MTTQPAAQPVKAPDTQEVLNLLGALEQRLGTLKTWQQEQDQQVKSFEAQTAALTVAQAQTSQLNSHSSRRRSRLAGLRRAFAGRRADLETQTKALTAQQAEVQELHQRLATEQAQSLAARQQSQQLQLDLKRAEHDLEQQRQALDQQTAVLDARTASLEDHERKYEARRAEAETLRSRLDLQRQLAQRQQQAEQLQQQLASRQAQLDDGWTALEKERETLADRELIVDSLQTETQAERARLAMQQAQTAAQQKKVEEERQQLLQQQAVLVQQRSEMELKLAAAATAQHHAAPSATVAQDAISEADNAQAKLVRAQEELAQQQARLDEQRADLASREKTLAGQAAQLCERQRQLEIQQQKLTQDQQTLAQGRARLEEQTAALAKQTQWLEGRIHEAEAQRRKLQQAQNDQQQRARDLDEREKVLQQQAAKSSAQAAAAGVGPTAQELKDKTVRLKAADAAIAARRGKLHKYRRLLCERSKALQTAQARSNSLSQQYEGLLQQRQMLLDVKQFLANSEAEMVRRWATSKATSLVSWAVVALAILAAASFFIGQNMTDPIWRASTVINLGTPLAPTDPAAWLKQQRAVILGDAVLTETSNQLAQRGLRAYDSIGAMRADLERALQVSYQPTSRLTMEYRDADKKVAVATLESLGRAMIVYQMAQDHQAKRLTTARIVLEAAADVNPAVDRRLAYSAGTFAILIVLTLVVGFAMRWWLSRSPRVLEAQPNTPVAAMENDQVWPEVARNKSNVTDLVKGQLDEPEA